MIIMITIIIIIYDLLDLSPSQQMAQETKNNMEKSMEKSNKDLFVPVQFSRFKFNSM